MPRNRYKQEPSYLALAFALLHMTAQAGPAFAQSNPGLQPGQVPTAGQWNSYFSAKQDFPAPAAPSVLGTAPIVATPGAGNVTLSCPSCNTTGTGPGSFAINVRAPPFNATCNGTTDDTASIQAAINATPAGGTVYIPGSSCSNVYKVIGTGTCVFTATQAINFVGDGNGSIIYTAAVASNRDIFCIQPAGPDRGYSFRNFHIGPVGSTGGNNTLNFKTNLGAGGNVFNITISGMLIEPTGVAGGVSIRSDGGFAYSQIDSNNIESISLFGAGDGVSITRNVISNLAQGTGCVGGCLNKGIFVSMTSGSVGPWISQNVIATRSEMVEIAQALQPVISANSFETPSGFLTNATYLLNLSGSAGQIHSPYIVGNNFSVLSGVNNPNFPTPVHFPANVFNGVLTGGRLSQPSGSQVHVVIDAGAADVQINDASIQCILIAAIQQPCIVTDNGTRTQRWFSALWTPTLSAAGGGGFAATTQVGSYERMGREISARFLFNASGTCSGVCTGAVTLGGLPFLGSPSSDVGVCSIVQQSGLTNSGGYTQFSGTVGSSSSSVSLLESGSGQSSQVATVARFGTPLLVGVCNYRIW